MRRKSKSERQKELLAILRAEPFLTDDELASRLNVSVATIRLDRLEMGVPEMRERARHLAEKVSSQVISMRHDEIIGEVLEIEVGKWGISLLRTGPKMGFAEKGIVRGHHLFAQANSLAVAVIDSPGALTAAARMRFLHPVYVGENVLAKAEVESGEGLRRHVHVVSSVDEETVFDGHFVVWAGVLKEHERSRRTWKPTEEGRNLV
ncbi:MAG TPA: transcription factor FapR [Firmicutes bacterium]|nr:transcription factor FapR [Bacillota bacterium]